MYPTRRGNCSNVEYYFVRPNPTFIFQDTFVEGTESTDITDCNETESEEDSESGNYNKYNSIFV